MSKINKYCRKLGQVLKKKEVSREERYLILGEANSIATQLRTRGLIEFINRIRKLLRDKDRSQYFISETVDLINNFAKTKSSHLIYSLHVNTPDLETRIISVCERVDLLMNFSSEKEIRDFITDTRREFRMLAVIDDFEERLKEQFIKRGIQYYSCKQRHPTVSRCSNSHENMKPVLKN